MSKVFISSTSLDLQAYRAAAIEECNRLGLVPLAMEYFPAMGLGAVAGSMAKLDEADLYVGIFAHRYGYVEAGHERSVTETEFDYAGETRRLERLCYLIDPNYPWPDEAREKTDRLEAFHKKIQTSLIRDRYTTPIDFQGKLRLALIDWRQRQGARFVRQPPLSLRLLDPMPENRLKHGARATAFVGRASEIAALTRFLDGNRSISWLVVAGPPGSGKSRLVQEFCRSLDTSWRAGFLVDDGFDWPTWQPEVRTLIAIDYASEHVGEIRLLLRALAQRGEAAGSAPVRIVLIERDPRGRWMDELLGHRSDGYALEQIRHHESPLVLGPLAEQELWQAVSPRLPPASQAPAARDAFVEAMRVIDPECRPLFWMLAADAVTAGRNIRSWDRARLMRDVLAREAEGWRNKLVPAPYVHLLALSTLTGGLTEAVLETAPSGLELPDFDGFDRGLYRILSGCALDGDELTALKPDLIGEFFILEHLAGRNDAVTARRAGLYTNAAWRLCGGSRRIALGAGMQYLMPSRLVLLLHRMLEDYPDHATLPCLFARPRDADVDLHYWADLVGYAVSRLARTGHIDAARVLFDDLKRFDEEEARTWDVSSGLIVAGFALLDHARARGDPDAVEALVYDLLAAQLNRPSTNEAFCREAAGVVPGLLAAKLDAPADLLMARQLDIVRAHPDEDTLPGHYARALGALVAADRPIAEREQAFERLRVFTQAYRNNFVPFPALASAARELCAIYTKDSRLPDLLRMNQTIRGLVRLREQTRVARTVQDFEAPLPFGVEEVTEDLRAMRADLARSDVMLIQLMMQSAQQDEADRLLNEVAQLWLRCYPVDPEFANYQAAAIVVHADACAAARHYGQIPKAVAALHDIRDKFHGVPQLAGHTSRLARNGVVRAVEAGDLDDAQHLLGLLERDARDGNGADSVANFAEATLALCFAFQDANRQEELVHTARSGAWALRSAEFAVVLRERGGDQAIAEVATWIDSIGDGSAAG